MGLFDKLNDVYAEEKYLVWRKKHHEAKAYDAEIKALESGAESILRNGGFFARARAREVRAQARKMKPRLEKLKKKEQRAKNAYDAVKGE